MTIAVDVLAGVEGAESLWRDNGTQIVEYMNSMNPMFWPSSTIEPYWTSHLDYTIDQMNARRNSQWTIDIAAYDKNHMLMAEFSDLFSKGVIYQNMDMFCSYTMRAR